VNGCMVICAEMPLDISDLLEIEREKLHYLTQKYSLSSPEVLRQSRVVDHLILCVLKKDKHNCYKTK
jgi:hypothetical protein